MSPDALYMEPKPMAKKPEYTPEEIEATLPARPLRVDSNNRQQVRKWLVAHGFPSTFVYALSMTELALAFNDPKGNGMAGVQRKFDAIPADERSDDEPIQAVAIASNPPSKGNSDIEAAIRAIAESVTPKSAGIDGDAVRAIIREELPSLIPTVRIVVAKPDSETVIGPMPMHHKFPLLVSALSCGLHVCLVGPAGSGKTTAAEMAAKALGKQFRIEGGVSGEHKLTGFVDAMGRYQTTPYRDAFEAGHIFVKDEIDVDDPAAILTLNAGMANGYAAFPDSAAPIMKGDGFQVVACANTWGMGADRVYVGRNQLDGATLDRFVFIDWDYDERLEATLCGNDTWHRRVVALRHAAFAEKARIVISPRASMFGAKLLAAGLPTNTVEEMCIWKGVDADLRRRIDGRVRS